MRGKEGEANNSIYGRHFWNLLIEHKLINEHVCTSSSSSSCSTKLLNYAWTGLIKSQFLRWKESKDTCTIRKGGRGQVQGNGLLSSVSLCKKFEISLQWNEKCILNGARRRRRRRYACKLKVNLRDSILSVHCWVSCG